MLATDVQYRNPKPAFNKEEPIKLFFHKRVCEDTVEDARYTFTTKVLHDRYANLHSLQRRIQHVTNETLTNILTQRHAVISYAIDSGALGFIPTICSASNSNIELSDMPNKCAKNLYKAQFNFQQPNERNFIATGFSKMWSGGIGAGELQEETSAICGILERFREYGSVAKKLYQTDTEQFNTLISEMDKEWFLSVSTYKSGSIPVTEKIEYAKNILIRIMVDPEISQGLL